MNEILASLEQQIAQLTEAHTILKNNLGASEIQPSALLSEDRGKRRGRPPGSKSTAATKPVGKRGMSAEGRARIVAAQQKRWATSRKAAAKAKAPAATKKVAPTKKAAAVKAASAKPAVKKTATAKKVSAAKAVAKKTAAVQ